MKHISEHQPVSEVKLANIVNSISFEQAEGDLQLATFEAKLS